jgi:drug/metabolite transporter (DMT)-like permease
MSPSAGFLNFYSQYHGLFFSAFSTILCVPFILAGHAPMSLGQWFCLLLAGTCASIAQLNITAAYTYAPAAKISVFDYVQQILFLEVL